VMSFIEALFAILPDWDWVHRGRVHWLWAVLALVAVLAALEWHGRDALGRFLSPLMQRRLVTRPSITRTVVRLVLVTIALFACVLALMRPRSISSGETVMSSNVAADVVVVLDVSKSMLAEDVAPNRLIRARAEIERMVKQLEGHRLGLVAFAGRAVTLCPLTPDQAFFSLALRGVDTRTVSRGGTRIGDAVRTALKTFPTGPGAKLVVLITDGEDHESFPLDAAKEAAAAGVHVIAVGIGSEEGGQIQLTDPATGARTVLLHDGQPVISRVDGETLRQMALTTEGAYVPAGTSALDLESIVNEHVTPIVRAEADAAVRVVPGERYPWFVLGALIALVAAVGVGASAGERRSS
jgi:Ca-activated chloride channel family protein